MAVKPTYIYR